MHCCFSLSSDIPSNRRELFQTIFPIESDLWEEESHFSELLVELIKNQNIDFKSNLHFSILNQNFLKYKIGPLDPSLQMTH